MESLVNEGEGNPGPDGELESPVREVEVEGGESVSLLFPAKGENGEIVMDDRKGRVSDLPT